MVVFLAVILFASCATDPEAGLGQLEVRLHDAPGDYEQVNIFIERVEVNRTESEGEGWTTISEPQQQYDLLELVNGAYEVLGDTELESGTYRQIRLIISQDGTNVVVDGQEHSLKVPSGEQTGVKLNVNAEIREGIRYVLLLDFDAERSVVRTGQGAPGYILKPVIRATNLAETGNIAGTILPVEARAIAYAILNAGTTEADTLSTTFADPDNGAFMLVGLPADSYTVSVEPREEGFEERHLPDVEVTLGQTTEVGEIELDTTEEE